MAEELEGLGGDFHVDQLVLTVPRRQDLRIDIGPSLVKDGCSIELTIDAASSVTLEVHDPERDLWDSGILDFPLQIDVDDRIFELANTRRQGLSSVLVFEDEIAAAMRKRKGPKKAARSRTNTRAKFIRGLVLEADTDARFWSPELHVVQPQAKAKKPSEKTRDREPGIRSGAELFIADHLGNRRQAKPDEVKNMETVCDVALEEKASDRAWLALLEACMIESQFQNKKDGEGTSVGILQLTDDHVGVIRLKRSGTVIPTTNDYRRNVKRVCREFLKKGFTGAGGAIALAKAHPSWSAGQVAQAVQGSAYPSRYDAVKDDAQAILDEYRAGRSSTVTTSRRGRYLFERQKGENSFEAARRLADEVHWRFFTTSRSAYFADDAHLMRARPGLTIRPTTPWVQHDQIQLEANAHKRATTATIPCRVLSWKAPPGTPVVLDGYGPADGRWLVTDIVRPLFSRDGTITLERPIKELAEPGPAIVTTTRQVAKTLHVEKAYQKAREIARKKYPYVWGGGHASFAGPYDCSGAVSAVLHAAGLLDSPMSTTGLQNWGSPGRGDQMTVWVRETGDPHQSHTFIVFELEKGKKQFFESAQRGYPTGFHPERSTAGFKPRHWKESGTSGMVYKGQQVPKLKAIPPVPGLGAQLDDLFKSAGG
jgi:cell wall-associated NlpC family hydrolase